jgi:hypothetical protein
LRGNRPSSLIGCFPDQTAVSLARLLLSVWDRGADSLSDLIEHPDIAPEAKRAFYDVLARHTYDLAPADHFLKTGPLPERAIDVDLNSTLYGIESHLL